MRGLCTVSGKYTGKEVERRQVCDILPIKPGRRMFYRETEVVYRTFFMVNREMLVKSGKTRLLQRQPLSQVRGYYSSKIHMMKELSR